MVTNAATAAEWLASWGTQLRPGIARAVAAGWRTSERICRSAGNTIMADDYRDAAELVEAALARLETSR